MKGICLVINMMFIYTGTDDEDDDDALLRP